MGRMKWNRILFAGMLAGMLINTCEYLLHGVVLKNDWDNLGAALKGFPKPGTSEFVVLSVAGFLIGLLTLWLYAAIRPRFVSGGKAVLSAAAAVWMPGYGLAVLAGLMLGIVPKRWALLSMAGGLVELTLAAALGSLIYAAGTSRVESASAS